VTLHAKPELVKKQVSIPAVSHNSEDIVQEQINKWLQCPLDSDEHGHLELTSQPDWLFGHIKIPIWIFTLSHLLSDNVAMSLFAI